MISIDQPCYTLICDKTEAESFSEISLKADLENGDTKKKVDTLKKIICLILNGEKLPGILMAVIRFVVPLEDHTIKKLLLIFWEIVPKTSPDGKLLHEMLLVCDAFRKDLTHCNEYIRGSMLRFLCKLKEPELLEPLIPSIRSCLDHRQAYVRRNAVLAIHSIYRNFDFLIPDAPDLIANFLEIEKDLSCKRNGFIMLMHADQERALQYLSSYMDQINTFGDILQLVIVELIYKVCHAHPQEKSHFLRCIYTLLTSSSASVRYEAAAVKAAASCYIDLIVKESDNNVKLIVLDQLISMQEQPGNEKVLQEMVMDILRVLSSTDLEVKKKTLQLAMDLVSLRNIEELVMVLKKELLKTSADQEDSNKYRQLLVRTLHSCCMKFSDTAGTIIPVLVEFLTDTQEMVAMDVLSFLKEVIYKCDHFRPLILEKLLEVFLNIQSANVHQTTLWILGGYAQSLEDVNLVMEKIRQGLGQIQKSEVKQLNSVDAAVSSSSAQNLVTADGTYASQSAFMLTKLTNKEDKRPPLRRYLLDGNFFIGAVLATTLTKLALHFTQLNSDPCQQNAFCAESLSARAMTEDDADHLCRCLKIVSNRPPLLVQVFDQECRKSLSLILDAKAEEKSHLDEKAKKKVTPAEIQVDDSVTFMQLVDKRDMNGRQNIFESSLSQAIGSSGLESVLPGISRLSKVTQLTGFSDPVYAETYVHMSQFDIVLDVLLVNQTNDTLQNCTLELATLGDLHLVEKPVPVVLAPYSFCNIKTHVKVTSMENGIIFGNIVYDVSSSTSDRNVIVLDDIRIDIVDYIVPSTCTDNEFRHMWAEFEWENKLSVNTTITDLHEYLHHIARCTNMHCLTPRKALQGDCTVLAANFYARSIFGESALANVSIERASNKPEAPVTGHVRIRAKTQGMALSLGDKINMTEKALRAHHSKSLQQQSVKA